MPDFKILLNNVPLRDCKILIPCDADDCLRYAAEEFSRLFGNKRIETYDAATSSLPQSPCVRMFSDLSIESELFDITAAKDLIICGGSSRAVLYGVYGLAEKLLGYNPFTDDLSDTPKKQISVHTELTGFHFSQKPFFGYRYPLWYYTRDQKLNAKLSVNAVFSGKMDDNVGGSILYAGSMVHTFSELVPPSQYFEQHPEYFSMDVNGKRIGERSQLCLSNPEVLKIVIGAVKKRLTETPGAQIVSVSQNDNFNYCHCPACRALDEKYGGPQGSILTFVNAVAREIAKEFPNVQVDTLAYQYSRRPPVGLKPEKNVIIRLCSIEGCGNHSLDDPNCPQNQAFAQDLKDWSKLTDNLFIWDYTTNFINYLFPYPNLYTIYRNMRFFADCKVKGILSQGVHNSLDGEFGELKTYLLSKLMIDPYMSFGSYIDLIEKFMRDWYGPGYTFLFRYFEYLSAEIGNNHFHCYSKSDEILPAKNDCSGCPDLSFYRNAENLFDLAAEKAETDTQRLHIEKSKIHLKYTELYNTMDRRYIQADLKNRELLEKECEKLYKTIQKHKIELVREWGEGCKPNVQCFAISPRDWK